MASPFDITLECPLCFEVPEGEVHQCKNGHTFCSSCLSKIDTCPTCRIPLGENKSRNLKFEKMLNSILVPCKFKDLGCEEMVKRKELSNHAESCLYQNRLLKICNSLGYNCDYQSNSLKQVEALAHFQKAHGFHVQNQMFANLFLKDVRRLSGSTNVVWTPVILKLGDDPFSTKFIITLQVNSKDKSLWMGCMLFEDILKPIPTEYNIQFSIKPRNLKMSNLEWSIFPRIFQSSIARSDIMLKSPICKMPIDFLKKEYLLVGININVKVTTGEDNMDSLGTGMECAILTHTTPVVVSDLTASMEWTCLECSSIITNDLWYPCLQCPNWVLCQKCVDMGKHKQHILAMVKGHHQQRYFLMCATGTQDNLVAILPDVKDEPMENESSADEKDCYLRECSFNGCYPISGKLYICLLCPGKFDICQKCVDMNHHCHHILGVIRNSKQEQLCESLRAKGSTLMPLLASRVNLS